MLRAIKRMVKSLVSLFGYELTSQKLCELADDPLAVMSLLLPRDEVSVIVDGGASIGDTSERFSAFFPNARVYAFEPFPSFVESLQKKAASNPHIKVCPLALDQKIGYRTLCINDSEGTNSLLEPKNVENNPYGSLLSKKGEIQVKTTSLDKIFPTETIDILKLDLQGGEYDALSGAKKLLKEGRINSILCETMFVKQYEEQRNWADLVSLIGDSGFRIFNFYQIHFDHGRILQADALFVRQDSYDKIINICQNHFMSFSKFTNRNLIN